MALQILLQDLLVQEHSRRCVIYFCHLNKNFVQVCTLGKIWFQFCVDNLEKIIATGLSFWQYIKVIVYTPKVFNIYTFHSSFTLASFSLLFYHSGKVLAVYHKALVCHIMFVQYIFSTQLPQRARNSIIYVKTAEACLRCHFCKHKRKY